MRGLWILPTRRRIEKLKRFFASALDNKMTTRGVVLQVEETGGSWYLHTLLFGTWGQGTGDRIAIDLGQGWYVVNMRALLKEAFTILEDRIMAGLPAPVKPAKSKR